MLRSLYSGVSGLQNHQTKMDVLGNNIANINTIGFKGGRINFSSALSQTIMKAAPSSGGTGYINPIQIGMGMKTTSIESRFTQGTLETTGVYTDLALEGDGFFVLGDANNRLFTRAGQFFFNADGKLVNQRGLAVQGWMINDDTSAQGMGAWNIDDIIIDYNHVSDALATENVYFSGNLNAGLETKPEIWEQKTALNDGGSAATASSLISDLDEMSTPFVAGDTIEIYGTNPDGKSVSGVYTYAAGDTVQDLLDAINSTYTGATASIVDGKIRLTDDVAGESASSITLTNGASNTGHIDLPSFSNTQPGSLGQARTSVVVYDSLGGQHNLILEFEKSTADGVWNWTASTSGDETISSGASGRVTFDSDGKLTAFTFNDGSAELTMDPGNGADVLVLNLHANGGDDYMGLSQFESLSTLSIRDQDGRATGKLLDISIGRDGLISGTFSNGEIDPLGKIAVGAVPNAGGLTSLGDGLYRASIASGEANILSLGEGDFTSIISGALEMSNVDLSKEFTEMITAQRGFQANAKIITTADQLLDELVRLKR